MTNIKDVPLKPCPFCGGSAHIQDDDNERMFYITCDSVDCYCAVGEGYDRDAMPDHSFFSREEAAKAWNTRASTASPEKVAANRIWFDTEFIEDGTTIDLISIGMVRADGATYYAETDQWIPGKASQWVKDNVIIHLKGGDCVKPRDVIAREIVEFAGEKPEFWAYYADYDWVALCQLFGTMMQLPDGWPKFCRDIKQRAVDLGNPKLPEQTSTEHHALADAIWNKQAYDFLSTIAPDEAATRAAAFEEAAKIADAAMLQFADLLEHHKVKDAPQAKECATICAKAAREIADAIRSQEAGR